MNDTVWKKGFWPHMENEVLQTVGSCAICAHSRQRTKRYRHFNLFPTSGTFWFLAIVIPGLILQKKNGNICVIVMIDRKSTTKRAILFFVQMATHGSNVLHDQWIVPYGVVDYSQTYNGPQFLSKIFKTLCEFLPLKHVTATEYNLQTSRHIEK